MDYWTQSPENIFVAAHRGWPARYPENTMPSFAAALSLGVDQLETDIRITKDGELILLHDPTLDRTTTGAGLAAEQTLAQIRALDAGVKKDPAFEGVKVPLLAELFELVKDHPTVTLDLELKEYPTEGWEKTSYSVADRVIAMVKEYRFEGRVVYNTFDTRLHNYLAKKYPEIKRHVYFPFSLMKNEGEDPYRNAYCICMFGLKSGNYTVEDMKAFLAAHPAIRPWAPCSDAVSEEKLDRALGYRPELVTCNNPDEVLAWLRARGLHR